MDNEERSKLEKTLDRINFWIQNVDSKISFLLALSGVILGFVFTSDSIDKAITSYIEDIDISWSAAFAMINLLIFIVAIYYVGKGVWQFLSSLKGRIKPSVYQEEGLDTNSSIFFATIASSRNYQEYKRRFREADEENDLLSQIYINSKIVTKKFNLYNGGVKSLTIGIVLLIIFKLLSFINTGS
jgi:hypothetical protein